MASKKRVGRVLARALLFGTLSFAMSIHSDLGAFLHLPSLMLVVTGGLLLAVATHGLDGLLRLSRLIRFGGESEPHVTPIYPNNSGEYRAMFRAQCFERIVWIRVGIGIVHLLGSWGEPCKIGPSAAMLIMCPLDAHIISGCVFYPMTHYCQVQGQDKDVQSIS